MNGTHKHETGFLYIITFGGMNMSTINALPVLFIIIATALQMPASAKCGKDTDCKGDRICVDGECISPLATKTAPEQRTLSTDLGNASFYLHPLGLVQFGPILGFEIGTGSNAVLDLHMRYSPLGLAHWAIATEGFSKDKTLSFASMAVGAGMRYLFPVKRFAHRPYTGVFMEYGWDIHSGNKGDYYEWEGESTYLVAAGEGGFRWRIGESFFVGLGLMAGAVFVITDDWWYTNPELQADPSDPEVYPFAMLSFVLGWEFGRGK